MTDPAPTRRSALSYLTGGAVAVGSLVAAGGLMKSCAPRTERTSLFDLSDMQDDEMRYYIFADTAEVFIRDGDELTVFDAECPVSFGLGYLQYDSFIDGFFCPHCTNRFNRLGQLINRDGTPSDWDRAADYPLRAGATKVDGLIITLGEADPTPRLGWSSL